MRKPFPLCFVRRLFRLFKIDVAAVHDGRMLCCFFCFFLLPSAPCRSDFLEFYGTTKREQGHDTDWLSGHTFWSPLLSMFLHADVRIQVIQRSVRLVTPLESTQIQPFNLIKLPSRSFLVRRPGRGFFIMVEQAHLMSGSIGKGRTVSRTRSALLLVQMVMVLIKVDIGQARVPRRGHTRAAVQVLVVEFGKTGIPRGFRQTVVSC